MTKVFTANLFITNSRNAIEQFFFSKSRVKSFKSRLNTLNEADLRNSFIMSPNSNDEVISFSHIYDPASKQPPIMEVEMMETSKLIELSLLDNDPLAAMLSERLSQVKKAGIRGIESSDLTAAQKLALSKTFYVAYGTGDDITKWSGPHVTELAGAELSNGEANERVVNLTLVSTGSLKSSSTKLPKILGYDSALNDLSDALASPDYFQARGELIVTKDSPGWQTPDLNFIYRYVLASYMRDYSEQKANIIV